MSEETGEICTADENANEVSIYYTVTSILID